MRNILYFDLKLRQVFCLYFHELTGPACRLGKIV